MSLPSSCILFISLLLSLSSSISAATIPITFVNTVPNSNPLQRLTQLASTSITRAQHLKNAKNSFPSSTTPMFPYNGAYSVSLSFGTPPQSISMVFDTASSLTWLPCTKEYVCRSCSDSSTIPKFFPNQSSSAKVVGCTSPKCAWVHQSFDPKANCTQTCPPYTILSDEGSTGGTAMVETLSIGHNKIKDFLVGCSLFSFNLPTGIAGFGRGVSSLPSQLGLKKFSYCHVSHKFDNTPKSSLLLMDSDSDSGTKTAGLSYTKLLKNPVRPGKEALRDYYYVGLKKIIVGGKKVEIPHQVLVPNSDGNGGTIVDSETTFLYMDYAVFDAVVEAFAEKVKIYNRCVWLEAETGLRPCFDIAGYKDKDARIPEMELHFKGGAVMALPLENYFFRYPIADTSCICLAMVTDYTMLGPERTSGPAVILGNLLMQNFHVEYDLRNQRFGFRQQSCS